jgi:hypothetical protein
VIITIISGVNVKIYKKFHAVVSGLWYQAVCLMGTNILETSWFGPGSI